MLLPTSWSNVSLDRMRSSSRWWHSSMPSSSYFGRHDLSQTEAHSNSRLAASSTNDRPL